jgi:hypothetical protein
VKLRKNASDTYPVLSEAYEGEAMKKAIAFEWHEHFKEGCILKSQMKTVLITFFSIKGIVYFEFIPQGQTANQAYYMEMLKCSHEGVHRCRPELHPSD